jgi:hypothetical protein
MQSARLLKIIKYDPTQYINPLKVNQLIDSAEAQGTIRIRDEQAKVRRQDASPGSAITGSTDLSDVVY